MDEEELVLAVQQYPNLYDLSHPKYHDNLCKTNSWSEIGQKMNLSGAHCQKKWKSLRECLRKSLRNRETKSGQSAKKYKTWRLERQMEFIKPYLTVGRDRSTNLDRSSDEENLEDNEAADIDAMLEQNTEPTTGLREDDSEPSNIEIVADVTTTSAEDSATPETIASPFESVDNVPEGHDLLNLDSQMSTNSPTMPKNKKTPVAKKKSFASGKPPYAMTWKKPKPLPPTAAVFKEWVDLKKTQHKERSSVIKDSTAAPLQLQKPDHITKYFQSIEETVRNLPPHIIVRLKSQISRLVHEAEEEALNINNLSSPNFYYHNQNWGLNPGHSSNYSQMNYQPPSPGTQNNSDSSKFSTLSNQ